jgi:hypothetical protein
MKEIDYIQEHNKHLQFINVYDDTFTLNPERVIAFGQEMKKRGLYWFCEGHVEFVLKHPEVLKIMVECGLISIQFGIESGSARVLDAYHKRITSQMIIECIQICKKAGVRSVTGNFIIGGALECEETIQDSMALAAQMINEGKGIVELNTVYFAPYPNTQMKNHPEHFELKIDPKLESWSLNSMNSAVVRTDFLTTEQIYDKKHQFDIFLEAQYKSNALKSKKEDVLQCVFLNKKRVHFNPRWEKAYLSFPHIVRFMQHSSEEEQIFLAKKYIIRTFDDYVLEGDFIKTDAGYFSDLEKDILLNATGIWNGVEMAENLKCSLAQIEHCFYCLNEKCMVYASFF